MQDEALKDKNDFCFICGIESDVFEKKGTVIQTHMSDASF